MKEIHLRTIKTFTDLTNYIRGFVDSHCKHMTGCLHVYTRHTTACLRIYEDEVLLLNDTMNFLNLYAPESAGYGHDNIGIREVPPEERLNAHAHLRSLWFNTSEMIPVKDGQIQLGQWQKLFLVELDGERERSFIMTFLPEL